MKKFDFDNDTSENMFSVNCFSYIANERLEGEKQFRSKSYLLIAANVLECSLIVTHSNAASFSIKNILCKTNNILSSKNY